MKSLSPLIKSHAHKTMSHCLIHDSESICDVLAYIDFTLSSSLIIICSHLKWPWSNYEGARCEFNRKKKEGRTLWFRTFIIFHRLLFFFALCPLAFLASREKPKTNFPHTHKNSRQFRHFSFVRCFFGYSVFSKTFSGWKYPYVKFLQEVYCSY